MPGLSIKRVGYFGKMPKSGDFVSRNVDPVLKDGFDRWLQECLSESRAQMKEAWLGAFLTAPIWRFLLVGQFGGSKSILGVMIPSVDKVGRYFPLAALIELVEFELDQQVMSTCDAVLHEFEELLLNALTEEIDLEYFDYQIGQAARKYAGKPVQPSPDLVNTHFSDAQELAHQLGMISGQGGSIWWSEGSDSRQADLLVYRGMPTSGSFASFLRDPNHFRDLEWAWDAARDLGTTQQDNLPVNLSDKFASAKFHLISQRGADHGQQNKSTATISSEHQALFISDGRFGTDSFAMASRVLGRVVPAVFEPLEQETETNGKSESRDREFDRLSAFFATKFPGVALSVLTSPLSFACLFLGEPGQARLLMAGDYFCVHHGRQGVNHIFSARHAGEGPTIRQDSLGHYKQFLLPVEPGDRLLLSNEAFDSPHLINEVYESLSQPGVDQAANALWQNATIKGVPGNLVLAMLDFTGMVRQKSELQPDLRVE